MISSRTIREQLLFAFLFFALIIIFLSSASYWYLKKGDEVDIVKTWIAQLELASLDLIATDSRFFEEVKTDKRFFKDGHFYLLDNRRAKLEEINSHVDYLLDHHLSEGFDIQTDLHFIDSLMRQYDRTFGKITDLHFQRGYADFGLNGELKRQSSFLEQNVATVEPVLLLKLKRAELSYFLTQQREEVVAMNVLLDKLKGKFNESPSKYKEVLTTLSTYENTFASIVELDGKIGSWNESGLTRQLTNESSFIESEFDSLNTKTSAHLSDLMGQVKKTYLILLVLCVILSLVLSYIISYFISKPIRELAVVINKAAKSDFQHDFKIDTNYKTGEIKDLSINFALMLEQIQSQFKQIQRGNTILQNQNDRLVEYNRKLQDSEKKLKESDDAKTKFFSILSHDLRGPLNTQMTFLETFIKHTDSFSKEETMLLAQQMYDGAKSLSQLLNNLLAWSRSEAGMLEFNKKPCEVDVIFKRNASLFTPVLNDKGVRLEYDTLNESVLADHYMLDCILRNLLSNAIKFTPKGGLIKIGCEIDDDGMFSFSVKDSGVGMSQAEIQNLFKKEVYFSKRGTNKETGNGIGLVVCKDFVERHDGTIWVESEPSKGTTFHVEFPAAAVVSDEN